MLKESDCKVSQRFLQTDCSFGKDAIAIWQRECVSRCAKKDKNKAYFNYLEWKENANEIALFTLYAYADLKIPKDFSCVFDFNNPEIHIEVEIKLVQSIWEAWHPLESIDHGHKHLGIFRFENTFLKLSSNCIWRVRNSQVYRKTL